MSATAVGVRETANRLTEFMAAHGGLFWSCASILYLVGMIGRAIRACSLFCSCNYQLVIFVAWPFNAPNFVPSARPAMATRTLQSLRIEALCLRRNVA